MAFPDRDAYHDATDDVPDWGLSERGRVEGFYNREDYWVEWKDEGWQYTDGTSAEGPHEDELHLSDVMTISWFNASGDRVYATITGGLDEDYPIGDAIQDLEERDSGTPQ